MFHNKNIIKELSYKSFNSNKLRNRFIGSIIVIATFLLTFSSTLGANATIDMKNKNLYQGIFDTVSDSMLDKINKNKDVETYGEFQQVGIAKNGDYTLSIIYADNKTMELSNVDIVSGKMPANENEIVIEKQYLDVTSEKVGVGDTIKVSFRNDVSRKIQEKQFVICGFLKTGNVDKERTGYNAIVSKKFVKSDMALSNTYTSIAIRVANSDQYSNSKIKEKIKEIGLAAGIKNSDININDINVDSNNLSGDSIIVIAFIAVIVMLTCSIVIYNIFHVAILRRIREYGQLRVIGTTSRQIKRIVIREGNILSMKYIPLGIVLGCLASFVSKPSMWLMSTDIKLAFISGLIIYLTVMLSVKKPAKIAASVSPIEAIKYIEYQRNGKMRKKETQKITAFSLGLMNLFRNRKKTILTLISLVFSGILFICSASIMESIDVVTIAKQDFPNEGEYLIKLNYELLSEGEGYGKLQIKNPLTKELKEKIMEIDGIDRIETIKSIDCKVDNVDTDYNDCDIQNFSILEFNKLKEFLVEGKLTDVSLGDNNSIIVNIGSPNFVDLGISYNVGDRISMRFDNGIESVQKVFTISAIINNIDDGVIFYASDNTMDNILTESCNYGYEIISRQGYSKDIETQIRGLINREERLRFQSLHETIASTKRDFNTVIIALYTFVLLIAVFSLVNLSNTIITNVISRKKELGILQAIGMDSHQLRNMFKTENMCLTLGSFAISVLIGSISGYWICDSISKIDGLDYIKYHFPIWPILIYMIIIIMIQVILTEFTNYSLKKQSIIEKIGELEK